MSTIQGILASLLRRKPDTRSCDTCAFVDFFRLNGDGQPARLQAFCRCPGGHHENPPVPRERRCDARQEASSPVDKPKVGDHTLTI